MLKTKKVRNIKIDPIQLKNPIDRKKVCGGDVFDLYCNICIIAKKKSGKTTLIKKILEMCTNKLTTVIIFGETVYNDPNWKEICKYLKKKNIPCIKHTSLLDEKTKENVLESYVELFIAEAKAEEEAEGKDNKKIQVIKLDDYTKELKEKPPPKIAPEYIFIFDDFSAELQDKSLSHLMKHSRHYKLKTIVSTQYYGDCAKNYRNQFDYWILFKKMAIDQLQRLYDDNGLSIDFKLFKTIYNDATDEKYSFLLIDRVDDKYFKKFNDEYEVGE